MEGPLVAAFFLGGANNASGVRANLMVFILLNGIAVFVVYFVLGLLTFDAWALAILLGLPFVLSMALGARLFRGAREETYRRIAILIVAATAIVSLPIFDGLR